MNRTDGNNSNIMLMPGSTDNHHHHHQHHHQNDLHPMNSGYNIADNDLIAPESSLASNFSSLPLKHDSIMSRTLNSADYLSKEEFIHQIPNDVPLNLQATGPRYRSPRLSHSQKVSMEDPNINAFDLKHLPHDIQDLSFSEELPPFTRSMNNLPPVNQYYYKPMASSVDVYHSDFSDEFSNDNFCPSLPPTSTIFPQNDPSPSYILPEPQSDEVLLNSIELNENEKLLLSNEDLALLTQGKQGCCFELILSTGETIYTVVDSENDYNPSASRLSQDSREILSSVRPFEPDLSGTNLVDHVNGPAFENAIATSSNFDPRASPITTFHNDATHYPSVISSSLGKSITSTSTNEENFNLCVDFSAGGNDSFHTVIDPYQPVEKSSIYGEPLMQNGQTSQKETKQLPTSQPVTRTERVPSKMDYFPSAVNSITVPETGKKYPKKYSFYSNISNYMNQDSFDKGDSEKNTKSEKVINVSQNSSLNSIVSTSGAESASQSCKNVNVPNSRMEVLNGANMNETLQFPSVGQTQPVEKVDRILETIVLDDDVDEIDGTLKMPYNQITSIPTEHSSSKSANFSNGNTCNKFLNSFSEIAVISICDRPVQTRARASLPDRYLSIKRIKLPSNKKTVYGVFARTTIPIRTQFGPVEGVLVKDEVDEEATRDDGVTLQLTVQMETGKFYKLDVSNEDTCNWMKFVRPATTSKEQNLVVAQQGTSLYFTTTDTIQPMQELLVWYNNDYAEARNYKLLSSDTCADVPYEITSAEHQESTEPEISSSVTEKNKSESKCESSENIEKKDSENKIEDESPQLDATGRVNTTHGEVSSNQKKPKPVVGSTISGKKNEKSKKSLWLCTHCDLSFSNASVMNLHVLVHNNNAEEDNAINFSTDKDQAPEAEVNEDRFECPQCYTKFDDKKDVILHVSKHGLKVHRWADNVTNSSGDHEENSKNGKTENFNTKNYKCKSCSKSFKTALTLEIHSRFHSETATLECPMCELTFKKLADMREHVHTHAVNGIFTCPHCPKTYDRYKFMRKHIRACHGKILFCCKLCKKTCKSQYKLRSHMLRHSDKREFLCSICGKLFKRVDKLSEHVKHTHSAEREKHKMESVIKQEVKLKKTMDKKLNNNKVLRLITENVDNFFYKCYVCNIGFKRRGMLVNHLNSFHPTVRVDTIPELNVPIQKAYCDFYCLYCDKVYKSNSKRKAHILKSHPGAKLPSISERGSVLNDPFAKQVGNVISNPFNCEFCHRQYASRAKMLNHHRKNHADLLPPDLKAPRNWNAKKRRKKEAKSVQPNGSQSANEPNGQSTSENLPLPSMEFVTGSGATLSDAITTTTSIMPPSIPPIQSITSTTKEESADASHEDLSHLLGDDGRNAISQEQYVKLLQSSNNLSMTHSDGNSTVLFQQILTSYSFSNSQ